jgi:hypothetical protein
MGKNRKTARKPRNNRLALVPRQDLLYGGAIKRPLLKALIPDPALNLNFSLLTMDNVIKLNEAYLVSARQNNTKYPRGVVFKEVPFY